MLDCKHDRLDYGELLRPPADYQLDHAVATTYSADLGTLLSIPVALIYAQTLEGDISSARFQLLDAIKQFSSKVKVYHQKGRIHKPAKLNWLYAYLEEALAPILLPDAFSAFHPKLWVIRYAPAEDSDQSLPVLFRVIVLSRNLTFDRSWDVAVCLDGSPSAAPRKANQPLVDFLQWLDHENPTEWAPDFIKELRHVSFAAPAPFEDLAFHPIGIPAARPNPTFSRKADLGLVISPFLHLDALARLRQNTRELFLFSNRDELERLPWGALEGIKCYHLSAAVEDGEFYDRTTEGSLEPKPQKLHAKVFIFDEDNEATWFVGSANATQAAAAKNVEFMLELTGGGNESRVRHQIKTWQGKDGRGGPFVEFDPDQTTQANEAAEKLRQAIRRFEYALLAAPMAGRVEPSANGLGFDLNLNLDLSGVQSVPGIGAYVQPFNVRAAPSPVSLHPGECTTCVFSNISEVELSRFLLFRLTSGNEPAQEFLVRIEISGLPTDRLENILRKLIDSRDKFFDYLRFLLAEETQKEDLLARPPLTPAAPADDQQDWHIKLPIFEQLLITASRSPRKLRDIDDLVSHLAKPSSATGEAAVVPPEFIPFWEAFRSLIPAKREVLK